MSQPELNPNALLFIGLGLIIILPSIAFCIYGIILEFRKKDKAGKRNE